MPRPKHVTHKQKPPKRKLSRRKLGKGLFLDSLSAELLDVYLSGYCYAETAVLLKILVQLSERMPLMRDADRRVTTVEIEYIINILIGRGITREYIDDMLETEVRKLCQDQNM